MHKPIALKHVCVLFVFLILKLCQLVFIFSVMYFFKQSVFGPQEEPSNGVVCLRLSVYFLGRGLHPRRVTTVTRCSLPPSGLGQVGRHGDWVVTDFVTGPLGLHVWVNVKNTHTCLCTHLYIHLTDTKYAKCNHREINN